jgi:hypothetical protein
LPALALTQAEYGRFLLERGGSDVRAIDLLQRARAAAEALGMAHLAEQATASLEVAPRAAARS